MTDKEYQYFYKQTYSYHIKRIKQCLLQLLFNKPFSEPHFRDDVIWKERGR